MSAAEVGMDNFSEYPYKTADRNQTNQLLWPALKKHLASYFPTQKIKILEFGCGNGFIAGELARLGHTVTGIDTSIQGISLAKRTHANCEFIQKSVYDKPGPDFESLFDCVISLEVIEHLYYPDKMLVNAAKYLKDNGVLIISTPYHGYLKNLAISIFNKWDAHFSPQWTGGHIKFFSGKSIYTLVTASGFRHLSFSFHGRLPLLWKSMICCAKKVPNQAY